MRRFFLTAATVFAALTLQAQTWTAPASWTKSLTPVTEAKELGGTHTNVATDGSVFTTGTYNKETTFGTYTLANDDQMTSAYIAKYSADGEPVWAVGIYGAAIIRAIDTDTEGNVYVAGNIADEVVFNSTDNNSKTVNGMDNETNLVTGFIAKYDKDGKLKATKVIIPVADEDIAASDVYYPLAGEINFIPNKIQVEGSKVYISARYSGDVTIDNMKWEGSYLNVFGFMYADIPSMGIFSLDASDLTNATSIANMQARENSSTAQQNPESVSFVVDGNTVYAGFVGKGDQALVTASGTKILTMELPNDDSGNVEHAFILAKITADNTQAEVFHVAMHDKSYGTDVVGDMQIVGGTLYVGGTFYGELGFDKTKKSTGASDLFVASINPSDLSVNWAVNDSYDEGDVIKNEERFRAMVVGTDKVFIAGVNQTKANVVNSPITYNVTLSGAISAGDNVEYASINDNTLGKLATITNSGATTTVSLFASATAIETITSKTTAANNNVYTLSGQLVGKNQNLEKGIYIIGGKKVVVK